MHRVSYVLKEEDVAAHTLKHRDAGGGGERDVVAEVHKNENIRAPVLSLHKCGVKEPVEFSAGWMRSKEAWS